MREIKVLDVTLRDGGCVNDFNFGQEYMNRILSSLEDSGVDYIELGYIDEKKGTCAGRTQYIDEKVIPEYFLKSKKPGVTYVAMMDYGKFTIENFGSRTEDGIDGIRMAFHKKDWHNALLAGRKIIDKGYNFFIQPMITMRYTDMEMLELIQAVNKEIPDAAGFYIVDSFGEMRTSDVTRLVHLVDNNLRSDIPLGFHSHNNLQLSYSNAMAFLSFPMKRERMLDSSVMGMGKGAGNLNTELLLEHMNLFFGGTYKVAPLLELIDKVINVIHKEFYWGYSVEYYLSSINHCSPSYAAHFYNKHMLPIEQVAELLGMIAEDKKISFDKQYAEELYLKYNSDKVFDDTETIERLRDRFIGKKVLLIAPGKSILKERDKISALLSDRNVLSVALNHFAFETDYRLTTRIEVFSEAVERGDSIIAPSNVVMGKKSDSTSEIDYEKWIVRENGTTYDSSGVMSLLLMERLGVSEIILAGFDGFSTNINENYFDKTMRNPVSEEQAELRNEFYSRLIRRIREKTAVTFLTSSKYYLPEQY